VCKLRIFWENGRPFLNYQIRILENCLAVFLVPPKNFLNNGCDFYSATNETSRDTQLLSSVQPSILLKEWEPVFLVQSSTLSEDREADS
jgi:hypothetical protein